MKLSAPVESALAVLGAVALLALYVWSIWGQISGGRRPRSDDDQPRKDDTGA